MSQNLEMDDDDDAQSTHESKPEQADPDADADADPQPQPQTRQGETPPPSEPQDRSAPLPSNPLSTVIIHEFPHADDEDPPQETEQRSSVIIKPQIKHPLASISVPIHDTQTATAGADPSQQTPTIPLETKPRNSALIHKRKNTFEIEASLFAQNESNYSVIWLLYTFLYWTALTWIPIVVQRKFDANLWGFIVWCIGFIGMISTAYTIYIGHYPSGATKENRFDIHGIGRWTAALLTSTVIIDCCVIVYVSVELDNIGSTNSAANNIVYNTNLSRLVLHIVHIFWSSLFFYNRFFYNHKAMAIRAFIFEWGDIIWSCVVSFMITEPLVVDKIYFGIVGVGLLGWIIPMMLIKTWGTRRHIHKVATHLVILDLLIDAPVIVALLITSAYKDNVILWIDLIWKSLKLERSMSLYFVKYYLLRLKKQLDQQEQDGEENREIVESSEIFGMSLEALTIGWVVFVGIYWTATALIRCIFDNEITLNYEYYTWFFGIIGILCVLDACLAGYSAEKLYGKPFMAFTCLIISIDSILHAYELLAGIDNKDDIVGEVMMVFHCVALISSIVFYSHSFKKGIGYSFVVQWIDIILMFIVIEILNHNLIGDCFSKALCIGYFVVFTIKIIFWFAPIVLGYASNDKGIHMHMVVLDTFTDLPLVAIIIITEGYTVNAFVFVDIAFKVIVLLISYAYHLVISLVLARCID